LRVDAELSRARTSKQRGAFDSCDSLGGDDGALRRAQQKQSAKPASPTRLRRRIEQKEPFTSALSHNLKLLELAQRAAKAVHPRNEF
jgi:hypothetical protein